MFARLTLLMLILTIISGTSSLIFGRLDDSILLSENPLKLATDLFHEGKMEEVVYLAQFAQQYLPADHEYSDTGLDEMATDSLSSPFILIDNFLAGAVTGEAKDTAGFIGALTLDLFVIGDIRDLLVQGYKEFDSGQGDEVIMGLSTAGLLLTLVPELSWAPSLFKTFWRGNRVSQPFQKQIAQVLSKARKTGDYSVLKRMMSEFTEVAENLGVGPAMSVFKRVKSSEDLALLAKKAQIAPMESYTLTSLNGVKALKNVSNSGVKQSKLLKRVKLATRQQKIMTRLFGMIPLYLLFVICFLFMALFIYVLFKSRK
jgi:hypothetical protein